MNISKVAKATGLTAKTIRYYESIGLIAPPIRSENGYRSYSDGALRELSFVKRARETGFNLEECRELLALYRDEHRTSAQVKKLAQEKIVDLRARIAGSQAMLASLEAVVSCCHGDERPECPILDVMEQRDVVAHCGQIANEMTRIGGH